MRRTAKQPPPLSLSVSLPLSPYQSSSSLPPLLGISFFSCGCSDELFFSSSSLLSFPPSWSARLESEQDPTANCRLQRLPSLSLSLSLLQRFPPPPPWLWLWLWLWQWQCAAAQVNGANGRALINPSSSGGNQERELLAVCLDASHAI